jgi:hypothetical protein
LKEQKVAAGRQTAGASVDDAEDNDADGTVRFLTGFDFTLF